MNLLEKVNFKTVYFNVFMHLYMYLGTYIIRYIDHNVWTERFLRYKPTFFIFLWVGGRECISPKHDQIRLFISIHVLCSVQKLFLLESSFRHFSTYLIVSSRYLNLKSLSTCAWHTK